MKKKEKEKEDFQNHIAHFGVGISDEIEEYATNHALLHSRYIFTQSFLRIQYGYCTHCKQTYRTNGLRHGYKAICERCGSSCTVKASGISRKRLRDNAYFVFYEKSQIDPNVIVAKGMFVTRDYRGEDYKSVMTKYIPSSSYVFDPGKGGGDVYPDRME